MLSTTYITKNWMDSIPRQNPWTKFKEIIVPDLFEQYR